MTAVAVAVALALLPPGPLLLLLLAVVAFFAVRAVVRVTDRILRAAVEVIDRILRAAVEVAFLAVHAVVAVIDAAERAVFVAARVCGRGKVLRVPGVRLQELAELLFPRRTLTTIFEPILRDLQDEHLEALAAYEKTGRRFYHWKARWVVLRGRISFWAAVIAYLNGTVVHWIVKMAKPF